MTELPKIRSGILSRGDLRGMTECESLELLAEIVLRAASRDGFMHALPVRLTCKKTFEDGECGGRGRHPSSNSVFSPSVCHVREFGKGNRQVSSFWPFSSSVEWGLCKQGEVLISTLFFRSSLSLNSYSSPLILSSLFVFFLRLCEKRRHSNKAAGVRKEALCHCGSSIPHKQKQHTSLPSLHSFPSPSSLPSRPERKDSDRLVMWQEG